MTPSVRAGTGLPLAHTGRGIQVLAAAVGVFVLLEVIAAAVLCLVLSWSWHEALDAFVVTNSAIGLSFGSCGAVLAWHRPGNPIGWLFAAGGVAQATSALAAPLGAVLHEAAAPITVQRLLITIFSWSWPWAIGLVLPLALLLFPDGASDLSRLALGRNRRDHHSTPFPFGNGHLPSAAGAGLSDRLPDDSLL
jgi:two-component system, NarL family, sensor kinase